MKTLPESYSRQNTPNALTALLLWDTTPFGRILNEFGRIRFLHRALWEAEMKARADRAPVPKAPAIQGLLKKAYLLKERLESTPDLTRSALAREAELDSSQLTRLLNLTRLAPEIQSYIRGLPATTQHPAISDREWHRLARIRETDSQLKEFEQLTGSLEPGTTPMATSCVSGP